MKGRGGTSGRAGIRTVAVDWSGAVTAPKIWLAEARAGTLVRLERVRRRPEAIATLIRLANEALTEGDGRLVVGLDFAFSMPAAFLRSRGLTSALALWQLVAQDGEAWLRSCEPPFWGKPGRRRPRDDAGARFRETEAAVESVRGIRPKSVFQVGGAGAVGVGSLRGMPHLLELKDAGFSIWPFDPPAFPLAVEIYPRLLTRAVFKSDPAERTEYMRRNWPGVTEPWLTPILGSEDAFDAAVSALVMAREGDGFSMLGDARDAIERLEGRIWHPAGEARGGVAAPPGAAFPAAAAAVRPTSSEVARPGRR